MVNYTAVQDCWDSQDLTLPIDSIVITCKGVECEINIKSMTGRTWARDCLSGR